MAKRLVKPLSNVVAEVKQQLQAHYNITQEMIDAWTARAHALPYKFPNSTMTPIAQLWLDYEVQRDVIHSHIINIMKKWDPRICSPVSACHLNGTDRIDAYDGQHRSIAAGILGYQEIPCAVVETTDPNFASLAFEMLNDTGVKRLNPGDLHRNALVRYKNGSRELRNVRARTMQDQFDSLGIDLQDKNARRSPSLCGDNDYFFSHFKYAQKVIEVDHTGQTLYNILSAIKEVFPKQEEIDQGVFIGLYELHRISSTEGKNKLPDDWMTEVLKQVRRTFKSSALVHGKAKVQWLYKNPGATWSAPSAMANFLREIYVIGGGKIKLPYHGEGAKMGIEEGNVAPGLFPNGAV